MKGLRQAFGLNKKNNAGSEEPRVGSVEGGQQQGAVGASTTAAATTNSAKRDSLPGSPAASEKDLKKKSKNDRDKKDKKSKKGSASESPAASSPSVPRVAPWDPALPAPPATIVGADTISDDAIRFVNFCCDYFLKYATAEKGIFRISGDTSLVLRLKHQCNADPGSPDWGIPDSKAYIHEISSLFKLFFREMPIPLLTYDLYTSFVSAFSISEDIRVDVTRKLLEMLPEQNRVCLGILCRFLQQMSEHAEETLMDVKNLSVVFSPNILRPRVETPETLICDARAVYGTVADFMINHSLYFSNPSSPSEPVSVSHAGEQPIITVTQPASEVGAAEPASPPQQQPILFTVGGQSATTAPDENAAPKSGAAAPVKPTEMVQTMDAQYRQLRRMSQRAISTLRKNKQMNDEELEATMLSISERIKEGDIVVASSLMAMDKPAAPKETVAFSIDASTPANHASPDKENSDSGAAVFSPTESRNEGVVHVRTAGKRGARNRDAPFALKYDELRNLQAEIEVAEAGAAAANSAPASSVSEAAPAEHETEDVAKTEKVMSSLSDPTVANEVRRRRKSSVRVRDKPSESSGSSSGSSRRRKRAGAAPRQMAVTNSDGTTATVTTSKPRKSTKKSSSSKSSGTSSSSKRKATDASTAVADESTTFADSPRKASSRHKKQKSSSSGSTEEINKSSDARPKSGSSRKKDTGSSSDKKSGRHSRKSSHDTEDGAPEQVTPASPPLVAVKEEEDKPVVDVVASPKQPADEPTKAPEAVTATEEAKPVEVNAAATTETNADINASAAPKSDVHEEDTHVALPVSPSTPLTESAEDSEAEGSEIDEEFLQEEAERKIQNEVLSLLLGEAVADSEDEDEGHDHGNDTECDHEDEHGAEHEDVGTDEEPEHSS